MSKFGSGRSPGSTNIRTPSAEDAQRRVLQEAIGELAQSPETPRSDEAVNPNQRSSGVTEEGNLIPISERGPMVREGTLRPEWSDWNESGGGVDPNMTAGQQRSPDMMEAGPSMFGGDNVPAAPQAPSLPSTPTARPVQFSESTSDPITSVSDRSVRVSKALSQKHTEVATPKIDMYPSPEATPDFRSLNERISNALDGAERQRLIQQREQVLAANPKRGPGRGEANNLVSTLNTKLQATVVDPTTNNSVMDPKFSSVMAIATEKGIDDAFMGDDAVIDDDYRTEEEKTANFGPVVSKEGAEDVSYISGGKMIDPASNALRVGREIQKWWKAQKNSEGVELNQKLSESELMELGTMGIMTYVSQFPDMFLVRDSNNGSRIEITEKGKLDLENSRNVRSKLVGVVQEPYNAPQPAGAIGQIGEEKPRYKKKSQIQTPEDTLDLLEESLENQNSVGHVVDERRVQIAMTMLMPIFYLPIGDKRAAFAESFGLGTKDYKATMLEQRDINGMEEQAAHQKAASIMKQKKKDTAKQLRAAVSNMDAIKYLTNSVQPYTGRTAPTQTDFNPTASKLVRFMTRSKDPARIKKGDGRMTNNYLNVMALSFGQDNFLPERRIQDMRDNYRKYRNWGNQLKAAMEKAIPKDVAKGISNAIAEGQKVPPVGEQAATFFYDLEADLQDMLLSKGEDGPMAVDALIDFANYADAMENGRTHVTYVNAYIDGKTNGIANQGTMLGINDLALLTGAFRNLDTDTALEGGDVRDRMRDLMVGRLNDGLSRKVSHVSSNFGQDQQQMIFDVMLALAKEKKINKAVSMVFPYGKELQNLRGEIKNAMPEIMAENKDGIGDKLELLTKGNRKLLDQIIDAHHDQVVYSLFEIFGNRTFKARSFMRNIGFMHAAADLPFSIKSPSGNRLPISDMALDVGNERVTSVEVDPRDGRKFPRIYTQSTPQYPSAAAVKPSAFNPMGEAAGYIRGRSAVTPTQSMDAAVVHRTATGASWEKLKSVSPNGQPYFYQIFDAFKVDVNNFDVMTKEVNQNWLDITTRDWSFIEQGYNEYKRVHNKTLEKLRNMGDDYYSLYPNSPEPMGRVTNTFNYIGRLLHPEPDEKGKPSRLSASAFVKSVYPISSRGEFLDKAKKPRGIQKFYRYESSRSSADYTGKASPEEIMNRYSEFVSEEAARLQGAILRVLNQFDGNNYSESNLPKTITPEEAAAVIEFLHNYSDLSYEMPKLIAEANSGRAEIRSKAMNLARKTGWGALQYWAH